MEDLAAMCQQEHPRLVGMLGLYCGDRDAAEDLAQETLVRLCRDWRKVRKLDAPEWWLHRVAINLAHSHYRRKTTERRALSLLASRDARGVEEGAGIETLELLTSLPHRQRAAIVLHYYLDLPVREVASVMEIPEGTAKTLIHRGTRALQGEPGIEEARSDA